MANRSTIERIAKILAKASSDNKAEGEAALQGAYARMKRDGVTFTDLLSLPERELYQNTLVRLAELIVSAQAGLSPTEKRTLYAEYLKKVVEKFSPGTKSGAGESGFGRSSGDSDREAAARAYEERRRQEEARRGQSDPPPKSPGGNDKKPFNRKNGNTAKEEFPQPFAFDASRFPLTFSFGEFWPYFFGRGSLLVCLIAHPLRGAGLVLLSCFAGLFGSLLFLFVVQGVSAAIPAIAGPLGSLLGKWEVFGLPWFAAVLCLGVMLYRHERGWFPGVRARQTIPILVMLFELVRAVLWRYYGLWVWGMNRVVVTYRAWRLKTRG